MVVEVAKLVWCFSLQGRVLVINPLVQFMLWHWLNTLSLPWGTAASFQKILKFFWPGLLWLSVCVLSLPLVEDRQGLVCIHSQVQAFHLQGL